MRRASSFLPNVRHNESVLSRHRGARFGTYQMAAALMSFS